MEQRNDLHDLLIRIDERVKAIQADISEINGSRNCVSHSEKIKSIEKVVYGTTAIVCGIGGRLIYEMFR